MQLLMFAASVRRDSCNKKLIKVAAEIARAQPNVSVDLADFAEFHLPMYDANMEVDEGLPENTLLFIERMKKSDGVIIASPEYNFSIPGTFKNLIDWVSRAKPMPWKDQRMLLMSASPSLVGGNRSLWTARVPLECCGAYIFPDMFSLSSAYTAFTEEGKLKDETTYKRLQTNISSFIHFVQELGQS